MRTVNTLHLVDIPTSMYCWMSSSESVCTRLVTRLESVWRLLLVKPSLLGIRVLSSSGPAASTSAARSAIRKPSLSTLSSASLLEILNFGTDTVIKVSLFQPENTV